MMRHLSWLYVWLISGALPAAALAQQAQSTQAAPPASSSSPATPSQPPASQSTASQPTASTTAPASTASPAHSSNALELTSDEKRLISKGYHLEVHNGQKTFCRREPELGSHFEKQVCGTAEQLATITQTSRDAIDSVQMRPHPRAGN